MIFDCDGVLVDSEPIARAVLIECFATHSFPLTPDQVEIVFEKGGSLANEIGAVEELFGKPVPAAAPSPDLRQSVQYMTRP